MIVFGQGLDCTSKRSGSASATKALLVLLCATYAVAVPVLPAPVSLLHDNPVSASPRFTIQHDAFMRDAVPVQIISGELHYFRIPRAYWRDRMERMKAMGFNTLQTYVAWNYHGGTSPSLREDTISMYINVCLCM